MSAYHEEFTRWLLSGTRHSQPSERVTPPVRRPAPPPAPAVEEIEDDEVYFEEVEQDEEFVMVAEQPRFSTRMASHRHPGEILARHLQALGLTASDLARDIDVPVNRITGILNKQRGVTADTALRLGHWFGIDPSEWLEVQLQYELTQAHRVAGQKISALPTLADRSPD